jgi:hypothetical protein
MHRYLTIGLLAIALLGCGTSKAIKEHQEMLQETNDYQAPVMIRTSEDDNRPDWTKQAVFEQGGKVYFSGGFNDGVDYALTIRCANAEALKSAVQSISQFIRAEFTSYVHGSNSANSDGIERYVSDGIATFADNIHVQGIKQSDLYYEELFSPQHMQTTFNVFVKLEMSKGDYLKAKADVLKKLRDKFADAGETQAKEKAEQLLEDLKNDIKTVT